MSKDLSLKLMFQKFAARLILPSLLFTLSSQLSMLFAQSTAFTYQGRLSDNAQPANGIYDLRFTIYDTPGGGTGGTGPIIAGPLTNSAVTVTDGLFTVTLDFGSGVFTGSARWLDIGVRSNGPGAFVSLSPRQELTPSPYAVMANSASNLLGTLPATQLSGTVSSSQIGGTYSGQLTLDNAGNVLSASQLNVGALLLSQDQGGSIELGNSLLTNTTPYIDFHYGVTSNEDYNVRLINDSPSLFAIEAATYGPMLRLSPSDSWLRADSVRFYSSNWLPTLAIDNQQGTIYGNGGSLTNLNASQLTSGKVNDSRLSTNVPLLNAQNQIFSGTNTFTSELLLGTNGDIAAGSQNTGMRIVSGIVDAGGGTISGTNFSVFPDGNGIYVIYFDNIFAPGSGAVFSRTPAIAITVLQTNAVAAGNLFTFYTSQILQQDSTVFVVQIMSFQASYAPGPSGPTTLLTAIPAAVPFNFVAIGPRGPGHY